MVYLALYNDKTLLLVALNKWERKICIFKSNNWQKRFIFYKLYLFEAELPRKLVK